jgi:hypothetical protein
MDFVEKNEMKIKLFKHFNVLADWTSEDIF